MMRRYGLAVTWFFYLSLFACSADTKLSNELMPYYLDRRFESEFDLDDNKQVLLETRTRIAQGLNATYGVVMLATEHDISYSVHTIPIWRAYCEKHGYDFFLQEKPLIEGGRPHWTKPRLLMELISQAKWKYIWLVDPNSMPVDFGKGFTYLIKEQMRKQRYKNDAQKDRLLWCPEDCERDYTSAIEDGACYGPQTSGCIFWVKKKTLNILFKWYDKRKTMGEEARGLKMALKAIRTGDNYELMFWSQVGMQMGFSDSTFLATHVWDEKLGYNVRDQIMRTIGKHKRFGEILNKNGEHKPEL